MIAYNGALLSAQPDQNHPKYQITFFFGNSFHRNLSFLNWENVENPNTVFPHIVSAETILF